MPRLLVIDADSFLGSIYAETLRRAGFDVEQAWSGQEGLQAAMRGPDLIVLDVMMPRMAAFEILERLRAETATKYIPIAVLTDLGHRRDIERCRQLGVSQYMMKAHQTPQDVLQVIRTLLSHTVTGPAPAPVPYAYV